MNITVKTFEELTTDELYEILQLRSEIFVLEQACLYQDIDDMDQIALHVIGSKDNRIVSYARIFRAKAPIAHSSIGRVLVKSNFREHGYGLVIMKAAIQAINEKFQEKTIRVSAQSYLVKFYKTLGFEVKGEEYLEDDIPHIGMIKK